MGSGEQGKRLAGADLRSEDANELPWDIVHPLGVWSAQFFAELFPRLA